MALDFPRKSLLIGILVVLSPVTESFLMRDILSDTAALIGAIFGTSPDCQFTCENGAIPQPRPGYSSEPNGCGTFGISMTVDGLPGFTECCNEHDRCYGRCGSDKLTCDRQFSDCLAFICDTEEEFNGPEQEKCRDLGKLAFGGTAIFGCGAFVKAQKESCQCGKRKRRSDL